MMGILAGALAMAAVAPIGFSCSAQRVEAIAPVTAEQACAAVRSAVEQALGAPLAEDTTGGISVSLTFGAVIAKAEVTDSRGGTVRTLPTLYHSSVDRSLDAGAVKALARAIAGALAR